MVILPRLLSWWHEMPNRPGKCEMLPVGRSLCAADKSILFLESLHASSAAKIIIGLVDICTAVLSQQNKTAAEHGHPSAPVVLVARNAQPARKM
jgi:hypothetical protein